MDFSHLLDLVYEAAEEPALWQQVAERLAEATHSAIVPLLHQDAHSPGPGFLAVAGGDPDKEALYTSRYAPLDTRLAAALRLPPGRMLADDVNISWRDVARTEAFNDYYLGQLGVTHAMGSALFHERGRFSCLSFHRTAKQGPFQPEQVAQLERRLLPHVARALRIQRQLGHLGLRDAVASAALDRSPLATIAVTGQCRVVMMNRAAERLLARRGHYRVKGGILGCCRPDDTVRLLRAVIGALSRANPDGTPGEGAEDPLLVGGGDGEAPLATLVARLHHPGPLGGGSAMLALLFIADPAAAPALDAGILQRSRGLTQAEARLAVGIAQGQSVEEIAAATGVTLNTSRTLLKRAMQKLEVRSQAQLAGAVLQSLAALVPAAVPPGENSAL